MPDSAPSSQPDPCARLRPWIGLLGGASVVLGALALIGWRMDLPALMQLRAGLPPMQYNTALCFVATGAALGLWARRASPHGVSILGAFIAALGALTSGEYLLHANLGVDQLFFCSYITTGASEPGRMSPVSAFCFILAGGSLLLLAMRKAPAWRPVAMGSMASVIVSISLAALAGYAFGLPGTYGWGQLTRVAAHSAAGLTFIGLGLFTIAWNLAPHPGESTPRWLPVALALGILTSSLVLSRALELKQNDEIIQTVRAGAEGAKNQITARMEGRIRSLVRMAQRWEFSGAPPPAVWENDAANYVHDFPDLQALEWIDAGHRVRWIVPLAGNEAKLNLDLTREVRRKAAIEEAEREHQPVITRLVTLFRGGLGFVIYVPIVAHGQPDGFIAAVFNGSACLGRYLTPAVATGEAITVSESGQLFFQRDSKTPPLRRDWVIPEKIELHGVTWDMRAWPMPDIAARLDSPLPEMVLLAGALGSLLLGAVCYYAQRSARHAAETERANAALQDALDKVRTLEGLLPICCSCKRVRDDTGYWNQIDSYIGKHTNASLSHGYCPECAVKAFEQFGLDVPDEVQKAVAAGNFE